MRALLITTSLLLAACKTEQRWTTVDVHQRDGWNIAVPRGYVPYAANAEQLKAKSAAVAALVDPAAGARRDHVDSTYVLITADLGCSLVFRHEKGPGTCERLTQRHQRHGETQSVTLPNGVWTALSNAGRNGGTMYAWDLCRDDELWAVLSATMPTCHDEAKAREPELLRALGAAPLTAQ